jgi:outer membrane protein assembly factor BamB
MRRAVIILMIAATLLTACDIPDWVVGGPKKIKRAKGERIDVILAQPQLKPDEGVADQSVDIPDQAAITEWTARNNAMLTPHAGLTGIEHHDSASIGRGSKFTRNEVPGPIVVEGTVIAMDAMGYVSAHDSKDIGKVRWLNKGAATSHTDDVLGGGLAYGDGTVFASTGYGKLVAIDFKTGKTKWRISVGAPVRGAPAVALEEKRVIVLTADNQTLAYDLNTGEARWGHRGIRESAGYFSSTSPVVSEGIVISAYSSGELFALRAETGSVLWTDTIVSDIKTNAAAVFSGIDADPIVQDGVVVVTSASGEMQASALLNGRPLWQQHIGAHTTPWPAGNAVFVLASTHDLVAIFKRSGLIRWSDSLTEKDMTNKDITPPLFGPILAGNAVMVVTGNGELRTFRPQDGTRLGTYEIADGVATDPVVAEGALFLISKDATLHKYY